MAHDAGARVLAERLAMYEWRRTELIANFNGADSVALLFSDAPTPELWDWLAWYAGEKAKALRDKGAVP